MGDFKRNCMPAAIKSKEAKAIRAANTTKSIKYKKKWSKGQTKEKANHLCLFNADTYNKLLKEVPKYKLITLSVLVERFNINGTLACEAIKYFLQKKLITPILKHS